MILITTRCAGPEDVDTLLADVQAGFDSYVSFAGENWHPPNAFAERERCAARLAKPDSFALIALVDGRPAGHVAFFPAHDWVQGMPIPGLAHLWQLFVLPPWWGRGVAPLLHDAAVAEMAARGFERARLYTPIAHARARRFYERRGWQLVGEEWNAGLRLMLVEYHRGLEAVT
jgi:GNAT superfamily N-acetyltransferase